MALAPLELCHGLHTSSTRLANALNKIQPVAWVLENRVSQTPELALNKHRAPHLRVLVANQNREREHQHIVKELARWIEQCEQLEVVVIGDAALAKQLPQSRIEYHQMLDYGRYRLVLRSCQLALLPLEEGEANACKTPIKLLECAAESVAAVCGPELYERFSSHEVASLVTHLNEVVPKARALAGNQRERIRQVTRAHAWVKKTWQAEQADLERIWLYQNIWKCRRTMDAKLVDRVNQDSTLPPMQKEEFGCCG